MDKIARIYQELDKRYQEYRAKMKTEDFTYYEGMADALDLFEQFLDTLSEEPDKSLKEAAEEYIKNGRYLPEAFFVRPAFIAGAEWQASQMPMPEDTVLFQKGVAEGRRLEREDMLKDAVEGTVEDWNPDPHPEITISLNPDEFVSGDKVRIIVLKEEEQI